ncbi:Gram-negative binding gnbp-like protein [Daphnia magna]|uniref:Gram-negative binding gnbp-like protein n=1 Tax=Daphnia magna TaxID=35525 RepID=A0A164P266_9CRUS|nr:Gram-negative binding gnbp-like protein [Daphnia magna]
MLFIHMFHKRIQRRVNGMTSLLATLLDVMSLKLETPEWQLGSLPISHPNVKICDIVDNIYFVVMNGSFATEFHTYGLHWLPTGIVLLIDGEVVGSVCPTAGGFWKLGGYSDTNIWQNGTIMALFDKRILFMSDNSISSSRWRLELTISLIAASIIMTKEC